MTDHVFRILGFAFVSLLLFTATGKAQNEAQDGQTKVAMRMIGHQVLLSLGDSTSRVLPIEKEEAGYRIRFDKEFGFHPDSLVATIERVVTETKMAERYLVEVHQCDSHELVYSYLVAPLPNTSMLPCGQRLQPVGCYSLLVTIMEAAPVVIDAETTSSASLNIFSGEYGEVYRLLAILLSILFVLIGVVSFMVNRKSAVANLNMVSIGNYQFDQLNAELWLGDERTELTSKESDLLLLLLSSVNETVERELILKNVWGDEGDYVGRTLDVFISKLRKKLESDPNIKIVNIRGIGYKLVLND